MNMSPFPTPVEENAATALLKIGRLTLVIPRCEIRAMEAAADVDTANASIHQSGWIGHVQQRWPVYCLSDELALLAHVPPERRTCVLLNLGAGYIGVLCDDISIMQNASVRRSELPAAMWLPGSPILGLLVLDVGMACISDARHLAAYIEHAVGLPVGDK